MGATIGLCSDVREGLSKLDRLRHGVAVNAEILRDLHAPGVLSPVILGEEARFLRRWRRRGQARLRR